MKQKGTALKYASEELRNDRGIVLEAVKVSGEALQYASEELLADSEITDVAIKQNASASEFVSDVKVQGNTQYLKDHCRDGHHVTPEDILTYEVKNYDNHDHYVLIPYDDDPNRKKECFELTENLVDWVTKNKTHPVTPSVRLNPSVIYKIKRAWDRKQKHMSEQKHMSGGRKGTRKRMVNNGRR